MSAPSETLPASPLTEILRALMNTRQTGYLKIKEGGQEGFVAIEGGMIVYARSGPSTALPALFQFVGWREAHFEFHARPMPADLARDLAVYDPQVLIEGVAFKEQELALQKALASKSPLSAAG